MIMTEQKIVYGVLYTQGLQLELLEIRPQKPIPVEFRETMFSFLVRDVNGYARTLYVSKGDFAILVTEPETKPVLYEVMEEPTQIQLPETSIV